ncbi:chondroitin proteoglycan 1-like [Amphibalanus amphitrite]|uniref:chondroitin proteoglycan 1-like n=1 Tax=Amphibalanus amphitrite TaxID=1232801 RepID=UPI001C90CF83|nr:chondroitin proteoglycan 1-like [Amphibalanus amphitrite]
MERVAALVAALWLLGAAAELTLPPSAFIVHSASWGFTEGDVPPEEVLKSFGGNTECWCKQSCLSQPACLSWFYEADVSSCTHLSVRGNTGGLRPATASPVFYRHALAFLGDWCADDRECSFLTSGVATCQSNTCFCPVGLAPINKTTCGEILPNEATSTNVPSTEASSIITTAATMAGVDAPATSNAPPSAASSTASTTPPTTASTTTPAAPTEPCVHGQFYPDETDCRSFFTCSNGVLVPQSCGTGTAWDQSILTCNLLSAVVGCV